METTFNKPVHEVRIGAIKAAVWANQVQGAEGDRTFYNVTLGRLYKDENDQWRTSDSFGKDDLPTVAKVAVQAHGWVASQVRPAA